MRKFDKLHLDLENELQTFAGLTDFVKKYYDNFAAKKLVNLYEILHTK